VLFRSVNLSKYRPEDIDDLEDGTVLRTYAGMKLSRLSMVAEERSLTGLEFAAGIPGTVGGGVVMNAGAFGGEMKDILVSTTVVTKEGQLQTLKRAGLVMGYRTVSLPEGSTVLQAVVRLKRGEREVIHRTMTEWNRKRKEAQPLEIPSAGSVFRNPEGKRAKDLIQEAGLPGFQVGGAQVSLKHGNFIVNTGGAKASDVIAVIQEVQERVFKQFGVMLKMEVKIVGDA
jgi:UDP-N-acetylmuramate dehydrogenase